ncbi:GNAT family N-acetyltransferase [Ureibacillus aquaedulcis]|uniref:GNAT family N-acetyltransferase n=1 Tax=Ureibacillus aquaedulcis TaxID=3058421 RepID=A0ABT8GKL1_9BACL|nr:GNAT family N-acetyltransferase [Ureibacillus sp. BA0131]MDN4491958.1 GNAT family N-acetyltransferase [Ureibacillus sp. BA0131]
MKNNSAEIGIAFGESNLWGKGIGFYSTLCIMEYALNGKGITIFRAETHAANIRSRRMLEKIGYKEVSRIGVDCYLGVESQLVQYRLCAVDLFGGI